MQQGNFGSNNRYGSGMQQQQGGGNFQSYGGMNPGGPAQGGHFNVGQQQGPQGIVWTPPSPQEKQYYDMLFQIADDERTGSIGGRSAVMFFTKSGLDKAILREIWTIADSRQTSFLLLNDFYVAMRLIALAQNGHPVTLAHFYEVAASPFALARLEGVPPPQLQQQQPPAPPATYSITSDEKTKYQTIFAQYDTDRDGFLLGQDAAALFQMSGMDRNDLRTVWTLADRTSDGRLDLTEFYIAMHLIVCVTKRGLPLPQTLPVELEQSLRSTASFSQSGSGHFPPIQQPALPPLPPQGMSAFDDLESPSSAQPTDPAPGGFDRPTGSFQNGGFPSSAPVGGPPASLSSHDGGVQGPHRGGSFGIAGAIDSTHRQSSFGGPSLGQPSGFGSPNPGSVPSPPDNSQRQASFGSPAMDGFGMQAPHSNSFGSPSTASGSGTNSRQASFVAPSSAAMDGFKQQATHTGSFGAVPPPSPGLVAPLAPPPATGFGSNSRQASFGAQSSSSASSAMDGIGKHAPHSNSFGLPPTTPQSHPSPASAGGFGSSKGATALSDFGSPLSMAAPSPSGLGKAPPSPGDFSDFGLAAPATSVTTGFGSTHGHQPGSGGFGGFDSPVPAPQPSGAAASGFGSSSHPVGFGDFGLAPAAPPATPPPTSGFASNSQATDVAPPAEFGSSNGPQVSGDGFGDFGLAPSTAQPPATAGFGSIPKAPSSVSSAFDDFPSPTNASGFGDFSGATSASGGFGGFGAPPAEASAAPSSSGFGTNPPPPQPSSDFGGFGISPPSASPPVVAASSAYSSNKAIDVAAPSGFGSTKPESNDFGDFGGLAAAPPTSFGSSKVSSGFDDFPSPTNSSGFGDFTSSATTAPAADFGDFGVTPAPSSFGSNKALSLSDLSLSSPAAAPAASIVGTAVPSPPASTFGGFGPSDVATTTSAPFSSGGFDDFPSPISTTTFQGFGSTKQAEPAGFDQPCTSSDFGDFSLSSGPSNPVSAAGSFAPSTPDPPSLALSSNSSATARELDSVNASLLRSLTQLAVAHKNTVQVAHIQHLATNLLRLTAQRDQLRAAQSTDPTLALTIQRLIDDERAFISTTSAVLQELEHHQKQQKPLSRQPSSSSNSATSGNTGFGAFQF